MEIFVRHGENDFHKADSLGKRQADATGGYLAGFGFSLSDLRLFSSPRDRAQRTAEIIGQKIGHSRIEVVPWLDVDALEDEVLCGTADVPDHSVIILVTHEPVIQKAYIGNGQCINGLCNERVINGSVHMWNERCRIIERVFEPRFV